MSEQTWVDPNALRDVGRVFGESARSVELAVTALTGCSFGGHMGSRYGTHAVDYAVGMLAVSQSMGRFAKSSRRFGDGLTRSADDLAGDDSSNAETFRGTGPGSSHG